MPALASRWARRSRQLSALVGDLAVMVPGRCGSAATYRNPHLALHHAACAEIVEQAIGVQALRLLVTLTTERAGVEYLLAAIRWSSPGDMCLRRVQVVSQRRISNGSLTVIVSTRNGRRCRPLAAPHSRRDD